MYISVKILSCQNNISISSIPEQCCFGQTELYGKNLNVSVYGAMPYVIYVPDEYPPLTGSDVETLIIMAKTLQFIPGVVAETG